MRSVPELGGGPASVTAATSDARQSRVTFHDPIHPPLCAADPTGDGSRNNRRDRDASCPELRQEPFRIAVIDRLSLRGRERDPASPSTFSLTV